MEDFDQAHTYDQNSSEQREDGINLINLLTLTEGASALDLGCGTGYLTKVLADKVGYQGKVRIASGSILANCVTVKIYCIYIIY